MKKYWYFTALVVIQPQLLEGLSQEYYVSAVMENSNIEGKFTLGSADIKISELLKEKNYIKNLLDIVAKHYIFTMEVPKYEFDNQKPYITKK